MRPGQLRREEKSGLPLIVCRTLLRLRSFPKAVEGVEDEYLRLAHIVDSSSESRIMAFRMAKGKLGLEGTGGAAFVLSAFARFYFSEDEVLAHFLPELPRSAPWWPKRRAALGWSGLGERMGLLLEKAKRFGDFPGLSALCAGLWVQSLTEFIKSQVLERLAAVSPQTLQRLEAAPPNLTGIGIDSQGLFCADKPELNYEQLFSRLVALKTGGNFQPGTVNSVTPLGWWTILLWLYGVAPADGFTGVGIFNGGDETADAALLQECLATSREFVLWDGDKEDFPWQALSSALQLWNRDRFRSICQLLAKIDCRAGVKIDGLQDRHFSILSGLARRRKGQAEVVLPSGRRIMNSWQISFAKTARGSERPETAPAKDGAEPRDVLWSESRIDGELIGLSLISEEVASLAGLGGAGISTCAEGAASKTISSLTTTGDRTEAAEPPHSMTAIPERGRSGGGETDYPASVTPSKPESDCLRRLRKRQAQSWRLRQDRPGTHARIALLQIEVHDSYRHPIVELCVGSANTKNVPDAERAKLEAIIRSARREPEKWNRDIARQLTGSTRSCVEQRRRKILEQALYACGQFDVDILVLPEYSVRPDTVVWLAKAIPQLAPKTSVWAGTYRQPPYSDVEGITCDPSQNWAAIMPVVFSGPDEVYISTKRSKKYPADGLSEIFRPSVQELEPVVWTEEGKPGFGDARDLVTELICAEIFMLSSPSNLLALGSSVRRLLRKFGLPASNNTTAIP